MLMRLWKRTRENERLAIDILAKTCTNTRLRSINDSNATNNTLY